MQFPIYAQFKPTLGIVRFTRPTAGLCVDRGRSAYLTAGKYAIDLVPVNSDNAWIILSPSPLEVKILDSKYKDILDDYYRTGV